MGLDTVELVIAWEKEFGINIPNDVSATLETPGKAIDWISDTLNAQSGGQSAETWTRDRVREAVRRLTKDQSGLEEFSDDDEFVRDMGLD